MTKADNFLNKVTDYYFINRVLKNYKKLNGKMYCEDMQRLIYPVTDRPHYYPCKHCEYVDAHSTEFCFRFMHILMKVLK